jgi:PBP1b-binding outer membrane lipoprotein LpoB
MNMKRTRSVGGFLMVMAALLVIGGCAGSHQARKVDTGATLFNQEMLQKGTGDQALYRYVNPAADIRKYNKVLVDQVLVRKDGELDKNELENYQKLANNAYVYLVRELEKDYTIVQTADPGTLRVQMAINDADKSKPVRNTLSTFMPIGMAVSVAKYAATGKQSGVGEITMEMKVTDASTGELLGAALDRRVGGKEITKLWSGWHNADDGLQYWAKRLSYALCDMRGGTNCVKP